VSIETRAVLAGAYRGGRRSLRVTLTHAVEVDAAGYEVRVLCGGVGIDSLADSYSMPTGEAPTCPRCAKKDLRALA